MVIDVLQAGWPWFAAIAFLLIYEWVAIASQRHITLSRMVWNAQARWRWLWLVVVLFTVLLYGHFFLNWWRYDPAPRPDPQGHSSPLLH